MRVFAIVAVAACQAAAPAPALHNASAPVARPTASEDTCALVAAMLAIDSQAFQDLYANKKCGLGIALHDPLVVDLKAPPVLRSPGTACPGRRFELFDGDRDLQGAIIELVIYSKAPPWKFMATVQQPNLAPDPEGGFVGRDSYCHLIEGVVERTDRGWHAREQPQ